MPSDAFIGILTGLGAAHKERQKNIFDQEVDRRSKYEQFLQKSATDPNYRPEAQEQFANLYTTLIQTPYEKKLPKDFERQVTDAVTSVQGSTNLSQGGPSQSIQTGDAVTGTRTEIPEPAPFQAKMPARFSAEEKFSEAMRLLNAQLQARSGAEIETERQKQELQPPRVTPFSAEAGLAETDPRTRKTTVIREPELKPVKPPDLSFEEATYEDFKKTPELVAKYGASRIGFDKYKQDQAVARAHASRETTSGGELNPKQMSAAIQLSNSLKSHPAYMDMLDIANGIGGVQTGLSQRNGFGDIAAINAFQIMIDPGATVREGDVSLLRQGSGLLDKILSDYPIQRLRQGDQLPQATRDRMAQMAKELYTRRARNFNDSIGDQYKTLARGAGIDFSYVGRDFPTEGSAPTAPPGSTATAPEGTIIVDAQGNRMIKRGGQWVKP